MEQSKWELLAPAKGEDWLNLRMPEIQKVLGTLSQIHREVVGDDLSNLNKLHTVQSSVREKQQYVGNYLVQIIALQREVQAFAAVAKTKYKDAMGLAFTKFSEIISSARSYEEK